MANDTTTVAARTGGSPAAGPRWGWLPDERLAQLLRRRSVAGVVLRLFTYVVMLALTVIFIFPLIYMLSTSLKTDQVQFDFPPILPSIWDWHNYILGWTSVGFGHFYLVSITYAVLSTLGVLFSCSLAAYALARMRFKLRDTVFFVVVATLLLPSQVTLIPLYLIYHDLGWLNTLAPLIVPQWFAVNAFSIFLLRQFFLTLPRDLDDAARIDGCGEFDIWLRVVVPLSKPALGVVALFQGVGAWTDFFGPLIYEQSQANYPVSVGLDYFQSAFGAMHFNQEMAMTIVSIIPVFIVFFVFQRYFIRGIVLSGVSR